MNNSTWERVNGAATLKYLHGYETVDESCERDLGTQGELSPTENIRKVSTGVKEAKQRETA